MEKPMMPPPGMGLQVTTQEYLRVEVVNGPEDLRIVSGSEIGGSHTISEHLSRAEAASEFDALVEANPGFVLDEESGWVSGWQATRRVRLDWVAGLGRYIQEE